MPRTLIDGPGWDRLVDCVGALPGSVAEHVCFFECRLGETEPAADVTLPVLPELPLERYLIEQGNGADADASRALARFLGRRGHATSGLANATLVEYDIAESASGLRRPPGIYLRVRREVGSGRARSRDRAPRTLAGLLAELAGWADDEDERQAVERAFDALPPGARMIQSGAMPGREPRAIRLVARDIRTRDLEAFLERLAWPGNVGAVVEVLSRLLDVFADFWVAFDVTAGATAPRLGLELFPRGSARFTRCDPWLKTVRGDWLPIVDRLASRSLCFTEKAQGLLAWPGLDRVFHRGSAFFLYRGINHVKVVVEGDSVHAKAYAAMRFAPYRRRREAAG